MKHIRGTLCVYIKSSIFLNDQVQIASGDLARHTFKFRFL